MTNETNPDKKNGLRGFAGLSSLIPETDTTYIESNTNRESKLETAQEQLLGFNKSSARLVSAKNPQTDRPSPRRKVGKFKSGWVVGIIITVIGLIWFLSADKKSKYSASTTSTHTPSYLSLPAVNSPTQSPPAKVQTRPTEERPSIGNGNTLSMPQLRYCVAEKIRLDAAETILDRYVSTAVDRFNAFVSDYNNRCGEFRYRRGALDSARSEVEKYRLTIQAEGRERF